MSGVSLSVRRPAVWQAILLLFAAVFGPWFISELLIALGQATLVSWVVDTNAYLTILIPFVFWCDPDLITRTHWGFSKRAWGGIAAILALQVFLGFFVDTTYESSLNFAAVVGALAFSPVFEELLRALMLRSISRRAGISVAVILTSVLFAFAHRQFWVALPQCLVLAAIFLSNEESVAVSITAHVIMNLVSTYRSAERILFHS